MDSELRNQIDALVEKYSELLIGDTTPELTEKVKAWILYTYISKTMPPLAKHWNELFPEGKEKMKGLIGEIKDLNEQNRKSNK